MLISTDAQTDADEPWANPEAGRRIEEIARKQGIPLLSWGELQALYERGTDEEEEELWGGIFDEFTAEP
ncbi:hypothetical protein [Conexibacter arvalis]|nr:hypothetical protein [Conexibacter arvalis]